MVSQYYWTAECRDSEVIKGFDPKEICASSRLLEGKEVRVLYIFSVLDEAVSFEILIPRGCHPAIVFSRCLSMRPGQGAWEEPEMQRFGWEDPAGKKTLFEISGNEIERSRW